MEDGVTVHLHLRWLILNGTPKPGRTQSRSPKLGLLPCDLSSVALN